MIPAQIFGMVTRAPQLEETGQETPGFAYANRSEGPDSMKRITISYSDLEHSLHVFNCVPLGIHLLVIMMHWYMNIQQPL